MEAEKKLESAPKQSKKQERAVLYQTVWRWHFYAGIIFAPFLVILALSGAVYLFKPQIESIMYNDVYFVKEKGSSIISPSAQMAKVREEAPDQIVTSMKVYDDPSRTTEFSVMNNGEMFSVYVNPYTGNVAGSIKNDVKFTEIFKKLHSELIVGGTVANRLVELAACWAVILLITGLYIWWPRNKASIWGTILPRFRQKGRTFWRDMHAVPAFWLSVSILILILTGLPWSGVMGEQINRLATSTNTGYPAFATSFGEKPQSVVKAKDLAEDVPWASENMSVPSSTTDGYVPLSIEDATYIARNEKIKKPYTISMPQGDKVVYTIATSHSKPGDNATLHVDQYSGSILSDVRFSDYGIMAKAITMGIALHEGRLFGLTNQIIGLIICIGLIGMVVSSLILWRKRKPEGKSGAPTKPKDKKMTRAVLIIMLVMGVIMPLVGISIIIVFLLDRLVFPHIKPLKTWLN
ncbi:PepSY-associated TM helix domain-containing protein [Rossellomorea sp. FM04394]|uniref:PepSY-associated TM helix domain-containing protein n=1 Tax=Rossellomorea sp. FM04394 TaxID=3243076 RepID=UPI0035A737D0